MARAVVTIVNSQGLHARPISRFVETAGRFGSAVAVTGPDGTVADGRSIFSLMTLAAGPGAELVLETSGERAEEALAALVALVRQGFDER